MLRFLYSGKSILLTTFQVEILVQLVCIRHFVFRQWMVRKDPYGENKMNGDTTSLNKRIDVHCHVGLLGDEYPHWGKMSNWYRRQAVYKVFLFYGRIKEEDVSDKTLRAATEKVIDESTMDHVVCLALDPVYDNRGKRREDLSHLWVDNDYIVDLNRSLGDKVLLGASVHPFDPNFKDRVKSFVERGAVLLKWLPSAQQINLGEDGVGDALKFLATVKDGGPLPLLLHVGPEYAIPSSDPRTSSYDFLSWSMWDRIRNLFRGSERWFHPNVRRIRKNLRNALNEGALIIFAHCGLPYYAPNWLQQILEHSDFKAVKRYLKEFPANSPHGGRCFADVSACVTPFRRSYFDAIRKLPPESLIFGSDFPTPVFELSAGVGEVLADFKAVLAGNFERIIVPQDNLLDVNYQELQKFFPGHPMFNNFSLNLNLRG
jgi:hypothetical protein